MSNKVLEELLSEDAYCRLIGISQSKAKQDRVNGKGPRFIKIGKSVKYRPSDIQEYLDANVHQNTISIGSLHAKA